MGTEHGGVLSCLLVDLLFIGYFSFRRGVYGVPQVRKLKRA